MKFRTGSFLATGAALALGFASSTMAAITATDVQPIADDIELSVTNISPVVIGVLAVVLGVTVGIGLLKKLVKKAS
jgi:hypothetical protein